MEMGANFVHHMENAYLIMIKDAKIICDASCFLVWMLGGCIFEGGHYYWLDIEQTPSY
jgi:hypothetical protein